jgi:hypothetical protein
MFENGGPGVGVGEGVGVGFAGLGGVEARGDAGSGDAGAGEAGAVCAGAGPQTKKTTAATADVTNRRRRFMQRSVPCRKVRLLRIQIKEASNARAARAR